MGNAIPLPIPARIWNPTISARLSDGDMSVMRPEPMVPKTPPMRRKGR